MKGIKQNLNIFRMLKVKTKENIHSQFIISVINSCDKAKILFLEMLKDIVKENANIVVNANFKVVSEKTLKGTIDEFESDKKNGRVDIFLSDKYEKTDKYEKSEGDKNRILIENKIYAGEQKEQINKYYNQYWKDKNKGYKGALFYLTLEKKAATKYSAGDLESGKHYFLLSYNEHIIPWLKEILNPKNEVGEKLSFYIKDYIEILKELTTLSEMIETGCNSKDKKFIKEYNSYLELRFWNYIEEILIRNNYFLYNYKNRKYNYDKILQNHKGLAIKKKTFNYGIIFKNEGKSDVQENEESDPHFRISVEVDKNSGKQYSLFISKGKFTDSKWEGELTGLEYKTNEFGTRSNMEKIADKILKKLNQKYDLNIDFEKNLHNR